MEYVSKRKKKIKKRKKSRIQRRSPNIIPWEEVARKKMRSETFFPSFSARNTFCKSKFRQDESTINGIPYNIRDKSILLKIIDGTETEVSEYPWMASLQLSGFTEFSENLKKSLPKKNRQMKWINFTEFFF